MPRSGWVAAGAVGTAVAMQMATGTGVSSLGLAGAAVAFGLGGVAWSAHGTARPRVAATLVGVLLVAARVLAAGGTETRATAAPIDTTSSGPWTAVVVSVGTPRDGQQVATVEIASEAAGSSADAAGQRSPIVVAATLPRYPEVRPGLLVRLGGRLETPRDDDYGRYLAGIGVGATIRARDLTVTGDAGGAGSLIEGVRRAGDDALTRALPEPEAGLASGILIGLRDRVDRDLAAAFVVAGVSHVVAISGWNIAIVGAAIGAVLRGWPRRRRTVVTLASIGVYTILTGASPSVLRAAVMAAVVLTARESGRPGRAAAALGWAVAGLLVTGPELVTDPGFALSAAATGGLIAWATPLTARIAGWHGGRIPGWLAESLGVSLAAEFATLPIALLWFGRFAIIAPAVNLAVVPLVAPAMAAGTFALIGGFLAAAGLPGLVATILGLPGWATLAAIVGIVRVAAALPFASATLPPPANVVAAAIAAGAILVVAGRDTIRKALARRRQARQTANAARTSVPEPRSTALVPTTRMARRPRAGSSPAFLATRRSRFVAVLLAVAVVSVVAIAATRPDGRVRITVLDVGQGDAILVDGDRGSRMLIDGGPDPDRLLVALDAHVPPWDRRIDLLVLSHPHEDHVAGLALLLARYRVSRVVEPGMRGPGPGYRAWASELGAQGKTTGRLATGDRFAVDDIGFRVLWPDENAVPAEPTDTGTGINNVSIVLLGTIGHERFLLAGDIEEGIDPILLARGLPHVDFLKVAHHGSRTSSTAAFLDAVQPKIAAVSVGAKNTYGHPAPETMARIRSRHAALFRTDVDGTVVVTLDGTAAIAQAEGGRVATAVPAVGRTTAAPAARPVAGAGSPVVAFSCGIPGAVARLATTNAPPTNAATTDPPTSAEARPQGRSESGHAGTVSSRRSVPSVAEPPLLYHRADDGTRADRRRRPAPFARSTALGTPPRARGRRGRRLARDADRGGRHDRRSQAGRVGGPAP